MNKKLLSILLLLIFFMMSCNNKSTDPAAPLKDSQYVGKWYEEISNTPIFEIKQDGSIDILEGTAVVVSASGTDVIKEGDAAFKAVFSSNNEKQEISFVFSDNKNGSMILSAQEGLTLQVVRK
ncbi:hypothetical protein [Brachyspira pilosicoli]|uniref:hypothetical protein n=1 Tax=Brachyspira pilosicoli TaxID=52584 RepID=UPI00300512AD